jgi:cell division protein FtsQ
LSKGDLVKQANNARSTKASKGELLSTSPINKKGSASDNDDINEFENEHRISNVEEPNRIVGLIVFVFVVGAFIYGGIQLMKWLEDEQKLPVQEVIFSGERKVLIDAQMEAFIRQHERGSFFALNVNEVHKLLEEMPWVYRASVRKRWPSSLHIYLIEQQPVAIWNEDLLLNTQGDIFDGGKVAMKLPLLFGPGGSEKTALAGFNAMESLLSSTGLTINALFLSERFAWRVELSNGIRLNIGRQQFIDRVQNFIDIFPLLKSQNKAINYIDLRYDIGLAVGWQKNAKEEQEINQNND